MRLLLQSLIITKLLFFSLCTSGQAIVGGGRCDTKGGDFSLSKYQDCGTLTVEVQDNTGGANIGYIFDYDRISSNIDGAKNIFSYTYSKPGTYTILQVGSKNGTGFTLCKQVTVFERQKITATLQTCGNIASITLVDDAIAEAYDHVEINWGDNKPTSEWRKGDGLIYTHAYEDKIPAITVQGKHAASVPCSGLINYLDTDESEPSIQSIQARVIEMKTDGQISLIYTGVDKIPTETFYSEDNNVFVSTGMMSEEAGSVNKTISKNLDPEKSYQIKLVSTDKCGGEKDSDVAGTMVLTATAVEGENQLEWNKYVNEEKFTGYQLMRDKAVIASFQSIDELKYTDKDLICGQTYAYQVVALTDLVRSYSAPKDLKMFTAAPEKITKARVTVNSGDVVETDVVIEGKGQTSTYNIIVERAEAGQSAFTQVSGITNQSTQFYDNTVNTASTSYCYRFAYENSCPTRSEFSDPVCTILLKQSNADLSWNSESPFSDGLDFYSLIQNVSNAGTTDTPVGLNNFYALNLNAETSADYTFQVVGHSQNGGLLSFSNIVTYQLESLLLIPDIFTPNNDTFNEKFEVKGRFVTTYKMSIFNRWGQVVFRSEDLADSWDGNIDGKMAPAGYYIYKAEITDSKQKPFSKSGTFLLVR